MNIIHKGAFVLERKTPLYLSSSFMAIGFMGSAAGKIGGISVALFGIILLGTTASEDLLNKVIRPTTVNQHIGIMLGSALVTLAATVGAIAIAILLSLPSAHLVILALYGSTLATLQGSRAHYLQENRMWANLFAGVS